MFLKLVHSTLYRSQHQHSHAEHPETPSAASTTKKSHSHSHCPPAGVVPQEPRPKAANSLIRNTSGLHHYGATECHSKHVRNFAIFSTQICKKMFKILGCWQQGGEKWVPGPIRGNRVDRQDWENSRGEKQQPQPPALPSALAPAFAWALAGAFDSHEWVFGSGGPIHPRSHRGTRNRLAELYHQCVFSFDCGTIIFSQTLKINKNYRIHSSGVLS